MSKNNQSTNAEGTEQKPWFSSWFDSPYYPILYKERNDEDAQLFMDNLTHYLNLPEKATVLDLACGRGRHSVYLNQLGYDVTGADLSENSVLEASKFGNETLKFKVHDMREPLDEKYDAIFNLFTSFGYFENENDNLKTLIAIKESLSEYGFAVLDYLNTDYVLENLVTEEVKVVDDITFYLKRYLQGEHIMKDIIFEHESISYHFQEKVRAFRLSDFEKMMDKAGIYLLDVFGDYKLKKYHATQSERLILIFK